MIKPFYEKKIKIVLIYNQRLVLNGIKLLLNNQPDIQMIKELDNGRDALNFMTDGEEPDVIITHLNIQKKGSLEFIQEIREKFPSVRIIALSMSHKGETIRKVFDLGIKGYLLKSIDFQELIFALYHVYNGGRYLCEELTMNLLDSPDKVFHDSQYTQNSLIDLDIGEREAEVLQLISEGYTNAEIADKIFLSKRTVEGHRQKLIHKTGTNNTASLVRFATLHKLVK